MPRAIFHCGRLLCAVFILLSATSRAQIINVRTVPLLASEQFGLMPSTRAAMGEVSLAFDDVLHDPFINPAKLRRMSGGLTLFTPAWKHWANEQTQTFVDQFDGSVTNTSEHWNTNTVSMPLAQLNRGARHSSGFFFAFQILSERNTTEEEGGRLSSFFIESDFVALNLPLAVLWAMDIPNTSFALGANVDFAYVGGAEGVSLLYPRFEQLKQEGLIYNFRIGLTGALSEKEDLSVLLMQHNYRMHHEANRVVENKDQNHGVLGRVEYRRRLKRNLRAGVLLTANWKWHPKIPDYPLSGVPRDPGTTRAYNLGAGAEWKIFNTRLAADAIFEPIAADTWVEALMPTLSHNDRVIAKGEAVERHDYNFSNRIARLGIERELWPGFTLRAGAQTKFFEFDYYHKNEVTGFARAAKPQSKWRETLWTAGVSLRRGQREWLYTFQALTGNGLLRRSFDGIDFGRLVRPASDDFFIPPMTIGAFSIDRTTIFRQQLSLLFHL